MKTILLLLCAATLVAVPASAKVFDLSTATVADINEAFDAGALTSEKLLQLYLARIAAYDKQGPKVNAVITLNPNALAEARGQTKGGMLYHLPHLKLHRIVDYDSKRVGLARKVKGKA